MEFRRTRWVDVVVTTAALLSAIQLCNAVSMPPFRSIAAGLLFVTSFFGIQRIYSTLADILFILYKPAAPREKPIA